jgi:hypothetical protein
MDSNGVLRDEYATNAPLGVAESNVVRVYHVDVQSDGANDVGTSITPNQWQKPPHMNEITFVVPDFSYLLVMSTMWAYTQSATGFLEHRACFDRGLSYEQNPCYVADSMIQASRHATTSRTDWVTLTPGAHTMTQNVQYSAYNICDLYQRSVRAIIFCSFPF